MHTQTINYQGYVITTDKSLMKVHDIHKWLSEESYWCKQVPFDIFMRSFDHSFCLGILKDGRQVGFARLITDYATFGYLADVYVAEAHRKKGLSKAMLKVLFDMDWVNNLRGIKLQTKDGHGLYRQFGFSDCKYPDRVMEISRPGIYEQQQTTR
jgi:GNAT superfamily N-acetyltransferase